MPCAVPLKPLTRTTMAPSKSTYKSGFSWQCTPEYRRRQYLQKCFVCTAQPPTLTHILKASPAQNVGLTALWLCCNHLHVGFPPFAPDFVFSTCFYSLCLSWFAMCKAVPSDGIIVHNNVPQFCLQTHMPSNALSHTHTSAHAHTHIHAHSLKYSQSAIAARSQ